MLYGSLAACTPSCCCRHYRKNDPKLTDNTHMNVEINRFFYKIINNSLTTQQMNYLGEKIDPAFNLNKASGFGSNMPIPRQTAAQTLIQYFADEEDIVRIFSYMLQHEGERLYNRDLAIWGRDQFISLLRKHKWILDNELKMFFLDPFYEHDINLLKKIKVIDLRVKTPLDTIINEIAKVSEKMSIGDLEWRIVMRLYDLEPKIGELIRKIITMLLTRQKLQNFTGDLFVCLKELAINASKANYKLLYEKHVTAPQGITSKNHYHEFLERFRNEIFDHGNKNLIEFAKKEDRFITITFQSSIEAIEIWVTNSQNISTIEKQQILKKLGKNPRDADSFFDDDSSDDFMEGAGFGLNLILKVLSSYSQDPHPLKVVFYPDFIKVGFTLNRDELEEKKISSESV